MSISLNDDQLKQVNGGQLQPGNLEDNITDPAVLEIGKVFTANVKSGYLALRSKAEASNDNIIAQLWNGSTVNVQGGVEGNYVWVYCQSTVAGEWGVSGTGKEGYVNWKFLTDKF